MLRRVVSNLLLCLSSILLLTGYVKNENNQIDSDVNMMKNSQSEIFHSNTIGDYKLTIYHPDQPNPPMGWPIIYLLDGDSFFTELVNFVQQQSMQIVVVAIDYPEQSRRELDYLPNPPEYIPEILSNGKVNVLDAYGGADNFLTFLQTELKPAIEQRFIIDHNRQIIFGHSLGGLFVLHALFTQPNSFSDYIASSPSIWFNDRYIMQEARVFLADPNKVGLNQPTHLYLSVGELEQSLTGKEVFPSETAKQLRAQHLQNRRMVDNVRDLAMLLSSSPVKLLTLDEKIYPKQIHQTVGTLILKERLLQIVN